MDALFNPTTSPRTLHHLDDGGRKIVDELPVELQPKFTEQDAQREVATLTIRELTALQSDLTGVQAITNGFSGLGFGGDTGGINVYGGESHVGSGSSPPAPLSTTHLHLAALDQHMRTLPAQSTEAYFRATTECPDEVSAERKLLFLQCEQNSVPLAAQRLALYWQYRLDSFGEDRCFEPMTLMGAMRGEVVNMAKSGFFQLMPNTDTAGRAIIYARFGKRDFSRYSFRQEVAWLTYLLEVVVQNKSIQSRGFVLLMDGSNEKSQGAYTRQSTQYLQRALDDAFPVRMCSMHICNANPFVSYIVFPVVRRLQSKKMRLRTRLHRGSGDDLLRSLATFGLPVDRVPSDMRGRVVLDVAQFLIDRMKLEASHSGSNLPTAEQLRGTQDAGIAGKRKKTSETDMVGQADRTGGTLSSAASHHSLHEQAPSIDAPSAGAAAASHCTDATSSISTVDADNVATSTSITTIAATGACAVGGRRLPLYSPSDEAYLSPLACLIRSQIEIFSATEADVQARAMVGGFVQTISTGRVGIRCIHCRGRPAKERATGAVSYPVSIRVLNQAVRNWQRYHWGVCTFIPPSAREEFERLASGKKTHSSRKSQKYWIQRSEEMGLVDVSTNTLDGSAESEGIYFEADARALGLRVLMPSEEMTSEAARKKVKGTKKAGTSGKRKKDTDDKRSGDEDVASILLHFKHST